MATRKDVDELHQALARVLAQGERAMKQLGWTHADISWRKQLDDLTVLALASASEPPQGISPDYADSAE